MALILEDHLMTFSFMVAITFMLQFLHGLLEFKYPKSLDYRQLIKRWIPVFILSGLAFLEYFLSGAYYFTYFLAICLILLFIACLGTMSKYIYVLNESKKQGFNTNTTDALFYLNWKVRNLCSSDQVSDTFFIEQDGLTVFFGNPNYSFDAMNAKKLKMFKDSLTQSTMGHVKFGGFLVIKNNDNYISLSSNEFKMLNIPITKINQETFKAIQMLKI